MGKRNEGFCHICGEYTELTFEHVPPRKAGNHTKARIINGEVLVEAIADRKRLPWDLKGLKYKQQQRGRGDHTLCQSCNNNTGTWYGEDYVIFSNTMTQLLADKKPEPNMGVSFEVEVRPLNLMKQILSFFCSINSYPLDRKISEFILDKESHDFNYDKYILTMFLYVGSIEKFGGTFGVFQIPTPYSKEGRVTYISEICSYPLGFCLYHKTEGMGEIIGTDISNFAKYSYDKYYKTPLLLPVLTSNSMLPYDYRLKSEFNIKLQ